MAFLVVNPLLPNLTPSMSPRRISLRMKSGVDPLIRDASVTEMSFEAKSLSAGILLAPWAGRNYSQNMLCLVRDSNTSTACNMPECSRDGSN